MANIIQGVWHLHRNVDQHMFVYSHGQSKTRIPADYFPPVLSHIWLQQMLVARNIACNLPIHLFGWAKQLPF